MHSRGHVVPSISKTDLYSRHDSFDYIDGLYALLCVIKVGEANDVDRLEPLVRLIRDDMEETQTYLVSFHRDRLRQDPGSL